MPRLKSKKQDTKDPTTPYPGWIFITNDLPTAPLLQKVASSTVGPGLFPALESLRIRGEILDAQKTKG